MVGRCSVRCYCGRLWKPPWPIHIRQQISLLLPQLKPNVPVSGRGDDKGYLLTKLAVVLLKEIELGAMSHRDMLWTHQSVNPEWEQGHVQVQPGSSYHAGTVSESSKLGVPVAVGGDSAIGFMKRENAVVVGNHHFLHEFAGSSSSVHVHQSPVCEPWNASSQSNYLPSSATSNLPEYHNSNGWPFLEESSADDSHSFSSVAACPELVSHGHYLYSACHISQCNTWAPQAATHGVPQWGYSNAMVCPPRIWDPGAKHLLSFSSKPFGVLQLQHEQYLLVLQQEQYLQALSCHVDVVCPDKETGEKFPIAIHDFEGDQTYSEKPSHDFILTTSFEGVDASSYDALVTPGGLHLLLSVSREGSMLIQERVQRKCGGNCRCFLIDVTEHIFRVARSCTKCKAICWELMLLDVGFLTTNKEVQCKVDCLSSTYSDEEFPQFPWDPGGSELLHRLGGKPNFKKGGMSGHDHGLMGRPACASQPRPKEDTMKHYKSNRNRKGNNINYQNTKQFTETASSCKIVRLCL